MSNVIGLGIIMLWLLGFLAPYTYIGFLEILMILSVSVYITNKSPKLLRFISR